MQESDILSKYHNVAMVGVSPIPERDSNKVIKYLIEHGYDVIPVNPTVGEIMGRKSYPDLISIPAKIEIVDIFRRSEDVGPIVDQAIKIGAKVIWMQEGIENREAAEKARKSGLEVVMNKCMKKTHQALFGEKPLS